MLAYQSTPLQRFLQLTEFTKDATKFSAKSLETPYLFLGRVDPLPYYRFHEADGSANAITDEITGARLPKCNSAWKADGLTEVVAGGRIRFGVDPAEIISSIERDGLYLAMRRPG